MTNPFYDEYRLTQAILLYEHPEKNHSSLRDTVITQLVDIRVDERHGVVAEHPRNITQDFIQRLTEAGGTKTLHYIDEDVVAMTLYSCAWYVPAHERVLRFRPSSDSVLSELDGQCFPQPPLLFIAGGRGLNIFALKDDTRPTRDTPLYYAPYLNTYANGSICLGTTTRPGGNSPEYRHAWVNSFFESYFTHGMHYLAGGVKQMTHYEMWLHVRDLGHFDTELLKPTEKTLGEVLCG